MVESDYRRLSCSACSNEFAQKAATGRPPKFCEPCRNTKPKKFCFGCGSELASGRSKWCSKRCSDGTKMTREQYRASVRDGAKSLSYCMHCNKQFVRCISPTNRKMGYLSNKYCSHACRSLVAEKVRKEVIFLRALSAKQKAKQRIKTAGLRLLSKVLSALAKKKEKADRPCKSCGKPVGYVFGMPRAYCSKQCRKASPFYVASKKVAKAKRRAKERGAKAENINPVKVFMDAGWKCQICGKPTPQRYRGTNHKRAPELDHVVPLSKGGAHTWSNVQCACRECNQWKSDKLVVGQAGLFTGLM